MLSNVYFNFTPPAGNPSSTPLLLWIQMLSIYIENDGAGTTCLGRASVMTANAINNAVSFVQASINSPNPNTSIAFTEFTVKASLLGKIDSFFVVEMIINSCNGYSRNIIGQGGGQINNPDNWPITDCDVNIVNCQ